MDAIFRVAGVVTPPSNPPTETQGKAPITMMLRGTLAIEAPPVSLAGRLYEVVAAAFIRELNF
jgi:hypothetical protein